MPKEDIHAEMMETLGVPFAEAKDRQVVEALRGVVDAFDRAIVQPVRSLLEDLGSIAMQDQIVEAWSRPVRSNNRNNIATRIQMDSIPFGSTGLDMATGASVNILRRPDDRFIDRMSNGKDSYMMYYNASWSSGGDMSISRGTLSNSGLEQRVAKLEETLLQRERGLKITEDNAYNNPRAATEAISNLKDALEPLADLYNESYILEDPEKIIFSAGASTIKVKDILGAYHLLHGKPKDAQAVLPFVDPVSFIAEGE